MHDLIIRNAQVYDGLGGPPQRADVAVSQGRITHIGMVEGPAQETVDAQGLALMPGIVDLHTHYDAQAFWSTLEVHLDLQNGRYLAVGLDNENKMYDFGIKRSPSDYTPESLRREGVR